MTVLRQRTLEDMQLRGLAPKTQEAYIGAVAQLARHFGEQVQRISGTSPGTLRSTGDGVDARDVERLAGGHAQQDLFVPYHVLFHPSRPILDRAICGSCDLRRLDALRPHQIRNRLRQLQHAVIRPRAQVHLPAAAARPKIAA